nr:type VI secretion system tube protein TssD [Hymenobacter nitidus]
MRAAFATGTYSFHQATDYAGRPSTDVRLGLIQLTIVGEAASWRQWEEWMLDPHRRQSGRLVFYHGEGQTAKTVVFYDAFCVYYECRFDARGQDGKASFEVEVYLSAAATEVQGQFSEAHSTIPWATDEATRRRALSKPQEPSAALAALPTPPPPVGPGGADFMRFKKEKKPWSERPQSTKQGFLNSPKLTKLQLEKLAHEAQRKYGATVEVLTPVEMQAVSGSPTVRAMFRTELDQATGQRTGLIYVQKGATAYELIHEMMHAKQFQQLGFEGYWPGQSRLEREEFVFQELMQQQARFSPQEIKHAADYITSIKTGQWPTTS